MGLVARSHLLRASIATDTNILRQQKEQCSQNESELRIAAAGVNGTNGALQNQNRDQQNTINNCQTQAIKLLQPTAFQWHALALEGAEVSPKTRKQRWILLANKVLSPAEFGFSCSHPIIQAETKIVGSVADAKTVQIDKDHWGSQIRSPAWGPDSPVLIVMTLAASSEENTSCNFQLETVTKQ